MKEGRMKKEITPLLKSDAVLMIGTRFRLKISTMDNGVHPKSYMVVSQDLTNSGFSVKFFKDDTAVQNLVSMLQSAIKG